MAIQRFEEGADEQEYEWREVPLRLFDVFPGGVFGKLPHWHEGLEVVRVLHGRALWKVNGDSLSLQEDDLLMINAGRLHCALEADRDTRCRLWVFPPMLFPTGSLRRRQMNRFCGEQRPDHLLVRPAEALHTALCASLEQTEKAFICRSPKETVAGLDAFLRELFTMPEVGRERVPDPSWRILRRMVGLIQRHFEEPITAGDIAQAGGVSPITSRLLFKKLIATTPTQYLISCRLEKARKLLDKGMQASEAGAAVGFHTGSYFTEMFHRKFGMTPREYRRGHSFCAPVEDGAKHD